MYSSTVEAKEWRGRSREASAGYWRGKFGVGVFTFLLYLLCNFFELSKVTIFTLAFMLEFFMEGPWPPSKHMCQKETSMLLYIGQRRRLTIW